ncbi:MAG TPA: hypothetical protein PKZ39_02705, partial [Clostridia bacterium]|nr:hypothetical protein [Clostridia bacterium]
MDNAGIIHHDPFHAWNQLDFMLKRSVIPETSNEQIQMITKSLSEQISTMRKISLELFTEAQDLCQQA